MESTPAQVNVRSGDSQAANADPGEIPAWPYLTAEIPGIGGRLKQQPEDFVVEEIPAYEPCGEGPHLFLWIEKRDLSAEQLTQHLARVLGVARRDIGMAGLKDRRAVTRQYVSVPAAGQPHVGSVDSASVRLLGSKLHRNKLRTGHLKGNHFRVLLRTDEAEAEKLAARILARVEADGVPNYFGEQRFGSGGETLRLGLDLLTGKRKPGQIARSRRQFLLRLALSSVQSYVFNQALADRLRDGLWQRVLAGDVMQVAASGGTFVAEQEEVEQERFEAGEILITGPMFGPQMTQPLGVPLQREQRLLQANGLCDANFVQFRRLTSGTRRPYLVRPAEMCIRPSAEGLCFEFRLPRGAYATTVLREFCKASLT